MKGLGTSPGIGIGHVLIYKEPEISFNKKYIEDTQKEIERLDKSIKKALKEIGILYKRALETIGQAEAEIFICHQMLLKDPEYIGAIKDMIITSKRNSEWAISEVTNHYISLFEQIAHDYIKSRIDDIKDISNRLLRILLGINTSDLSTIDRNTIIVAHDLKPSDTAQINKKMVSGIVTEAGYNNSHTSIISRTMNIPLVCSVKNVTSLVRENDTLIVNGTTGDIIINPTEDDFISYNEEVKNIENIKQELEKLKKEESISKDGFKVEILGNIGSIQDLDDVLDNGGDGIGLYRTELLYMNCNRLPTEEMQFNNYKALTEKFGNKPLVIRTLDIGGDKDIPYLKMPKEMNPYLGNRAIRYSLKNQDILITQLRAILRASAYGNIKILFPLISTLEEIRQCKLIVEKVKEDLRNENIKFNEDIHVGMMVEIPAVVILSRQFAKEVDFFSIGTNDLIQYTLAAERGNEEISHLYSQYNPAVLSMIKMTIDNGHKEGIQVGICGELARDEKLIPVLLGMGLDGFSMNSSAILKARYLIRNTSKKDMETHIDHILSLSTSSEVEAYIDNHILNRY